jgi:hypothetical protein
VDRLRTVLQPSKGVLQVKDIHADLMMDRISLAAAQTETKLNAQALLGQARQAIEAVGSKTAITYLVLSIPPIELTPQTAYGPLNGTKSLAILSTLIGQYNQVLHDGVKRLALCSKGSDFAT